MTLTAPTSAAAISVKPLRFIRRGQVVSLDHVAPERTLLELLREDLGQTGTKEGCGEGDCGACTVVLGQAEGGVMHYRAINSCIRLAHSIDGMALWTVEDIAADPLIQPRQAEVSPGLAPTAMPAQVAPAAMLPAATPAAGAAGLHPAQEAMVQCHGSQCGFCTPGFVMSLFGMYQNHVCKGEPISRALAQEALSGNLCRCTGYRPILDAAQAMASLPTVCVDEAMLLEKLTRLAPDASASAPESTSADSAYQSPRTLAGLLQLRAAHPDAQLVAGCTDVGLWVTKQHRQFARIIDLTQVRELRQIENHPQHLAIGAAATLTQAFAALSQERPQLSGFASRFAGLPVRNSGTLGGNVANGSPIGDSMPLLIALGASVVLMSVRGQRELPLENFYTGYRQNVLAPDEVLAWIKVRRPFNSGSPHPSPLPEGEGARQARADAMPSPDQQQSPAQSPPTPSPLWGEGRGEGPAEGEEFLRIYKISKRYDDDISAVCLALNLRVSNGSVQAISIGAGGVAATPARAVQAEAALLGQPWTLETVQRAIVILRAEFQPISDMRASGAYRTEVLGNLLERFWLESQGAQDINLVSFTLEEDA